MFDPHGGIFVTEVAINNAGALTKNPFYTSGNE